MAEYFAITEPSADRAHGAPQEGKRRLGDIQALKPATQRGRVRHAVRILNHRGSSFPRAAFYKVMPKRVGPCDKAVVSVRRREPRQKRERLFAEIAQAAPNADPIVLLVMSLLAAAAMADDGFARTDWA